VTWFQRRTASRPGIVHSECVDALSAALRAVPEGDAVEVIAPTSLRYLVEGAAFPPTERSSATSGSLPANGGCGRVTRSASSSDVRPLPDENSQVGGQATRLAADELPGASLGASVAADRAAFAPRSHDAR
jgi:hypothetical protein